MLMESYLQLIVILSRVTLPYAADSDLLRQNGRMFSQVVSALCSIVGASPSMFIVRLVLLPVRFSNAQTDATFFLHHTHGVFKLAYNSPVSGCFHRFTVFISFGPS